MKKLITIAAVLLAAMFAKADVYLYWTVEVGDFNAATSAELLGSSDGKTYTRIQEMYALQPYGFIGSDAKLGVSASPYVNYLVRLYENTVVIAELEKAVTDEALVSAQWYGADGSGRSPATSAYSFAGFVVPEPTSGLLMLLGLGALALRRRQS